MLAGHFAFAEARYPGLLGILLHQRFLVLGHHVRGDLYADLALAGRVHRRRPFGMGVAGLSVGVVVLAVSVIVSGVALKCLPFNGLALFRLISRSKVLRRRVLRIV